MADFVEIQAFSHVNALVESPDKAANFLADGFGAPVLELEASETVARSASEIRHVGLGDTVIALIRPEPEGIFAPLMARAGPTIHSLCFQVSDLTASTERLARRGIHPVDGSVSATGTPSSSVIFDTMETLGFNLELIEAALPHDRIPNLRNGALMGDQLSPLLHIELAVDDLDAPAALLHDAFGSNEIETEFAAFLSTCGPLDIRHVNLGRVVLQYCRSRTEGNSWYDMAASRGKAIHNLTWLVRRMADAETALNRTKAQDLASFMLDFGRLVGYDAVPAGLDKQRIVDCHDIVGFNIELAETFSSNMDTFIFNPLLGWEERPVYNLEASVATLDR